jgi:hypothetical protein
MKKIALFLAIAFFSVSTFVFADGNKTKVDKEELPQEVIQSLEEGEYSEWEIQEAYKVKDEMTNEVRYELQLASDMDAEQVRNVTFNENGEIISDEFDMEMERTEDQHFEEQGTQPGFEGQDEGIEQGTEPGLDHGTEEQQY